MATRFGKLHEYSMMRVSQRQAGKPGATIYPIGYFWSAVTRERAQHSATKTSSGQEDVLRDAAVLKIKSCFRLECSHNLLRWKCLSGYRSSCGEIKSKHLAITIIQ